jgi:hypothetical protein
VGWRAGLLETIRWFAGPTGPLTGLDAGRVHEPA